GLTPRAVKELVALGVQTREEDGWIKNKGLRVIGGGVRMQIPWPELSSFPDYGLVRPRKDFDETLARHAEKAGARLLERTSGPILRPRTDRVVGVPPRAVDDKGHASGPEQTFRARVVVAADGYSSRLSL